MRRGRLTAPPAGTRGAGVAAAGARARAGGRAAARWPAMEALLAALERDPRGRRGAGSRRRPRSSRSPAAGYGARRPTAVAEARVQRRGGRARGRVGPGRARAAVGQALRPPGSPYAERRGAASAGPARRPRGALGRRPHGRLRCAGPRPRRRVPHAVRPAHACLRQRAAELEARRRCWPRRPRRDGSRSRPTTAAGLPPISACEDDDRLLAAVAPPTDHTARRRSRRCASGWPGRGARARRPLREALAEVEPLSREAEGARVLCRCAPRSTCWCDASWLMYQMTAGGR